MLFRDIENHYNNYMEQPIEDISIDMLRAMYKDLVFIATETAFDTENRDTEFLCRTLLLQHRINFDKESNEYLNPNWDESCERNGIKFEREKVYLIEEDRLDDYTRQLEYQNKKAAETIKELKYKIELMIKQICELRKESNEDCFIPRTDRNINECVKTTCEDCIKEYFEAKVKDIVLDSDK